VSLNRWRCVFVILLTLVWAGSAFAQIRSATITGAVTDPTKAVVPGATVIVVNQDTNSRTELVTNEAGLFTAPYLPAGTYSIEITPAGFREFPAKRHLGFHRGDGPRQRRAHGQQGR